ncbi:MAG TPA: class D sortase [Bryobacteraceae bacterium]|jgi:sortase A|nr:class D sortase [Bryobacteraceae bacterium]
MVVRVRLQPLWKLLLTVTADLLIVVGVAGMLVWIWGLADGALYQYTQGVQFANEAAGGDVEIAGNLATSEAGPRPVVSRWLAPALPKRDPLLLGRLEIPSIQLTVMVREGVDDASLRKAAGHLPSSPFPGENGNVVLLGHRDTFFRPLRGIAQGDPIRVRTPSRSFQYVVDSIQVVAPEQSLAFENTSLRSITLITCFPFDYIGPAPRRFVVRARMISSDSDPF